MKKLSTAVACCVTFLVGFQVPAHAQESGVPSAVLESMAGEVGVWITSNADYVGENEAWEQYGLEWTWGIGEKSLIGRLYGIVDGEERATFWQFRQFWHPGEQALIVQQFAGNGTFGTGKLTVLESGLHELIQTFYQPDGSSAQKRHLTSIAETERDGGSYDLVDGEWIERRHYVWVKQE